MEFSNGTVLEALRLVLYRQIPWHKRPVILASLHSQRLIQSVDHKPPADARYLPPLRIAILTDKGQKEIERIEASKHLAGWLGDDYFASVMEGAAFA